MTIPKKSLGQHWLEDEASLQAMCDTATITPDDVVLEIGPGLGTLTEKLMAQAGQVIAVEFDADLARQLPKRLKKASNVTVVHQDILSFDLTRLPVNYKVIANIPYYLTSNLIRVLSESTNPPLSATLLIQKEVAERVAAGPGEMSLLSVTAQMYFEPSLSLVVPAALFTPPPKVNSQIVHLQRRSQPLYGDLDSKELFRLVKAGFSNRRKTLHNSLSAGLHITKDETRDLLQRAAINPQLRPQDLALSDWIQLQKIIVAAPA
ncbi:MAG: 16S rRNA (adenine(1518)-N(6)/adenine(1519)-N(6))-dimethyltransferase RsmA [Candidatus Saccharimonadales bacterium]